MTTKITENIQRKVISIDADGKSLGRLAVEVAVALRGKNKPDFVPYKDMGDTALVKNIDKMKFTGNKMEGKKYFHFTGYLGNLKTATLKERLIKKGPKEVLRTAVMGMLTKNKLRAKQIKRLRFEEGWVSTNSSSNTLLIGENSGFTASLNSFITDTSSSYTGLNAIISSNVVSSNGVVKSLQVISSGYGFNRSLDTTGSGNYVDLATFESLDGLRSGLAFANLEHQGFTSGYYKDNNGFLSSSKKLRDGDYYQEFSYDIKTSVTPEKYQDMLLKLLHVAGKKWFSSVERVSLIGNTKAIITNSYRTIT